jgi:hypothetical protein
MLPARWWSSSARTLLGAGASWRQLQRPPPASGQSAAAELVAMDRVAGSPLARAAYGVFLLCAQRDGGGARRGGGLYGQAMGSSSSSSAWFTRLHRLTEP